MYLFTSCCFIAGHVSASNSFLSVPGISCYGKWWGFLNKAAEKAKCLGLSEEAEGHGRERSMPRGGWRGRKPPRAHSVCITACVPPHQQVMQSSGIASRSCITTRNRWGQWACRWRCPESQKTSADGADQGAGCDFIYLFIHKIIDVNLPSSSLGRWKCSCTSLLPARESDTHTLTHKVLSLCVHLRH